jgi:hypothetical protein
MNRIYLRSVFGIIALCAGIVFGPHMVLAASGQITTKVHITSVDAIPPTAPTDLVVMPVSSSQINVEWTASTDIGYGVSGYRLYRDGVQIATTTSTFFSDIGLLPQTTYSYYAEAFDGWVNISPVSNSMQAQTMKQAVSGANGGLTLARNAAQIISVEAYPDVNTSEIAFQTDQYVLARVYWGETSDLEKGVVSSLVSNTEHKFVLTDLTPNKKYYYKIEIIDNNGSLGGRNNLDFNTRLPGWEYRLTAVQDFGYSIDGSSIHLSWVNPVSDTAYDHTIIVESDKFYPRDFSDGIQIYSGNGDVKVETGLEEGKRYYFAAFACDSKNVCAQPTLLTFIYSKMVIIPSEYEDQEVVLPTKPANIKSLSGIKTKRFIVLQDQSLFLSSDQSVYPLNTKDIHLVLVAPDGKVSEFAFGVNAGTNRLETPIFGLRQLGEYQFKITVYDSQKKIIRENTGIVEVRPRTIGSGTAGAGQEIASQVSEPAISDSFINIYSILIFILILLLVILTSRVFIL